MGPDAAALDTGEVHGPGDFQVLDVVAVDVLQGGEPVRREVLVMMQPVARLLVDIEQPLRRHLVGGPGGQRADNACRDKCGREQLHPGEGCVA